jgi:pyridoxine 4-dehydrogenase
VTKADS